MNRVYQSGHIGNIFNQPGIPEWILTSFNDPTDLDEPGATLVRKAENVEDLKSGLSELVYGGGGRDIPEQAFKGTMKFFFLKNN